MFNAAIFDMDGLLIDSERAIMRAWLTAAREHGAPLAEAQFLQVVGRAAPESDAILLSLLGDHDLFRRVEARADLLLAQSSAKSGFPLKPGAADLLARLRARRIPCAVASSSAAHEIRHRLARCGVLDFFAAIAGGDEVPRGKPDPAVYQLAARRIGASAPDCLAFEDSDHGMAAAAAAGMRVVLVPDLKQPTPQSAAQCFMLLASLEHAEDHVDAWFRGRH